MTTPNTLIADLVEQVETLSKQRDELMDALEGILPDFRQLSLGMLRDDETSENHRCAVFDLQDKMFKQAKSAIARVKGGA